MPLLFIIKAETGLVLGIPLFAYTGYLLLIIGVILFFIDLSKECFGYNKLKANVNNLIPIVKGIQNKLSITINNLPNETQNNINKQVTNANTTQNNEEWQKMDLS